MKFTPRSTARSRRTAVIATVGLLALALVGCASPPAGEQAQAEHESTGFGHVHGIGVDSVSGVVYAATHAGVFVLGPLEADAIGIDDIGGPIAGRVQDTMGFTMDGAEMFASGHPDPADTSTPNPLGLIFSRDGAETWQTVSLGGEVDFHDLAVLRDPNGALFVYGYDAAAETISVSPDGGKTWTGGAALALRDLTADPTTAGTVYATTAQGLAVSTDFGVSFTLAVGAPALYLVESIRDSPGSLIGVAVDGTVWLKPAIGDWQATGSVSGDVEAMTYTVAPTPALVVADSRGVVVSNDFGATWRALVVL